MDDWGDIDYGFGGDYSNIEEPTAADFAFDWDASFGDIDYGFGGDYSNVPMPGATDGAFDWGSIDWGAIMDNSWLNNLDPTFGTGYGIGAGELPESAGSGGGASSSTETNFFDDLFAGLGSSYVGYVPPVKTQEEMNKELSKDMGIDWLGNMDINIPDYANTSKPSGGSSGGSGGGMSIGGGGGSSKPASSGSSGTATKPAVSTLETTLNSLLKSLAPKTPTTQASVGTIPAAASSKPPSGLFILALCGIGVVFFLLKK
jgi:hypothetical protein